MEDLLSLPKKRRTKRMERKIVRKYQSLYRRMRRRDLIAMYVAIGELTDSDMLISLYRRLSGRQKIPPRPSMAEWLATEVGFKKLSELMSFKLVRFCTNCGLPMGWGYCVDLGVEYFCCEECLQKHYRPGKIEKMFEEGQLDLYPSYWIDFITEAYKP